MTKKHRIRQYNSNIKFKNHEKINLETDSSNHHHSSYFYRVRPGCDLMYMKEEYLARSIQYIVVHCSATRVNIPFTEEQLLQCHLQRGFKGIGYHFYVTKDGMLHHTRPMAQIGAHAIGFNLHSLAICYEGGLDEQGKPADTRTPLQKETLRRVLGELKQLYPEAKIVGHYQLSANIHKMCPCFDARKEYEDL